MGIMEEKRRSIRAIPGTVVSIALIAYGAWMLWSHYVFAGVIVLLLGLWLLPFFLRAFRSGAESSTDRGRRMSARAAARIVNAPFEKPRDY